MRFAVVHHTAGSNSYTRAQSASIVRGIQRYHVLANGWDDIGYNFLVDKYGQIFEGRFGGVDRNVVGAHAQGFNQGSTGVALIGNYDATSVDTGGEGSARRVSSPGAWTWRTSIRSTTFSWRSTGNPKFPAGRTITLRTIAGHRDTGYTSVRAAISTARCPRSRASVAQTGLPKLYFPSVTGAPGGMVRFTGTLTGAAPVVGDRLAGGGSVIAEGSGEGTEVDWTWDARTIPAGRYVYAIDAGPTVRPATGSVAGATSRSMLTALAHAGADHSERRRAERLDGRPLPAARAGRR